MLDPMIADLGADHLQVWVRTAGPARVCASASPLGGGPPSTSTPLTTTAEGDYTASAALDGLLPLTTYLIEVTVDGVPLPPRQCTTLPANGDPAELRLVFASDTFRAYPAPSLAHIRGLWPHGVFLIGDHDHTNYLANTATAAGALGKARDSHRALREDSTPFGGDFQEFIIESGVPVLGHIADDHDCGADNRTKAGKWWPQVLQAMQEYWPVSADNGYANGYMYSSVRIGRTLVVLLDTRTHRDVAGAHKPLLGEGQWAWLENHVEAMARTDLDRMIVVSPVPVNPLQHKLDSWYGHPDEGARLVTTLAPITGHVVVMSGDLHWGSIALPPLVVLPEGNIPKLQEDGFANTGNNAAAQWTYNSLVPGGGFGLLTVRADGVLLTLYNADGTLRIGPVTMI